MCLHCKLHNLVALRGQKINKNGTCESKAACKVSNNLLQKALNRVLTLPKARARRELSIGVIYVNRASICVELRPFYYGKRNLVPMSYNSFWDFDRSCQPKFVSSLGVKGPPIGLNNSLKCQTAKMSKYQIQ